MAKPRWWRAPLVVWAFSLVALLATSSVSINLPLAVIGEWLVYLIPLGVIFYYVRSVERRRKFWPSVGVRKKNLGRGLIWAFAIFVILIPMLAVYDQAVTWLMDKSPGEEVTQHFERTYPDWYFVYFFFASFIPVGLFEELTFRGFVLDRLMVGGTAFAILTSSILHTSLHLWYVGLLGVTGIPLYGSAFILFVFFGLAYVKSGNIIGLALLHGLNNATLSVEHFFGTQLVGVIMVSVILIGIPCLIYLVYESSGKK